MRSWLQVIVPLTPLNPQTFDDRGRYRVPGTGMSARATLISWYWPVQRSLLANLMRKFKDVPRLIARPFVNSITCALVLENYAFSPDKWKCGYWTVGEECFKSEKGDTFDRRMFLHWLYILFYKLFIRVHYAIKKIKKKKEKMSQECKNKNEIIWCNIISKKL